jgi:hypothetical protein
MTSVFAVQDNTGTVSLLTIADAPTFPVALGDIGSYSGIAFNGSAQGTPVDLPFMVGQLYTATQFGVTSANFNLADWPEDGTVTWTTGENAAASPNTSVVTEIAGANAYIDIPYFKSYHNSRGNVFGTPSDTALQNAIVKATDYLDQKYRYKGIKRIQTLGNDPGVDIGFLDPWIFPFAFGGTPFLTPSTSTQTTEWPRTGVVDFSGDTLRGIPKALKAACAELAFRSLNGTALQPDYDGTVVANGAVVESLTEDVGPIRTTTTYDTKLGLGFFASFPQIDRMLSRAGLLIAGGGRTIMR